MSLIHRPKARGQNVQSGFTLVETLVAISLLTIAVVAPMSLTTQSLSGAQYARDQVTAYFLAQEAIEGVRAVRDANILATARGTPTDLLQGIPDNGTPFTIDVRQSLGDMTDCPGTDPEECPPLQTDNTLYGYSADSEWYDTGFTRSVTATYVPGSNEGEIEVEVKVSWRTGGFQERDIVLRENLYRWINDTGS